MPTLFRNISYTKIAKKVDNLLKKKFFFKFIYFISSLNSSRVTVFSSRVTTPLSACTSLFSTALSTKPAALSRFFSISPA